MSGLGAPARLLTALLPYLVGGNACLPMPLGRVKINYKGWFLENLTILAIHMGALLVLPMVSRTDRIIPQRSRCPTSVMLSSSAFSM